MGRGVLLVDGQEYPVSDVTLTVEEPSDMLNSRTLIHSAAAALALSGLTASADAQHTYRGLNDSGPDPVQGEQYGRSHRRSRWNAQRNRRMPCEKYKGSKAARKKTDHRRHKK